MTAPLDTDPPSNPFLFPVNTGSPQLSDYDDVESPSLSSSNALARFEFEPGRGQDGTKVLMVEWEDDETTRDIKGEWTVGWEGKRTVLPAKEQVGGVNRLYFLLPGGERVPALVTLTLSNGSDAVGEAHDGIVKWKTNPLPAIFSAQLGASARASGKKGVLHTIWAKKRLQVLAGEIEREGKLNAEGIALLMAIQERDWIEKNFGVVTKPATISIPGETSGAGLNNQTSPRSPGGGRLMEKLRGLRLDTREADASVELGREAHQEANTWNPLSPEGSDVAVGSFKSFAALKGMPDPTTLAAKPAQPPQPDARRFAAQRPPDSIISQHRQATMSSMDSFTASYTGLSSRSKNDAEEDGLFALPMSPRSPDMSKSPFSFVREDTMRYITG